MSRAPLTHDFPWPSRWADLAHAVGLRPAEPVVLALSGGADSVFLLHLLARAQLRPRTLAVHVDHGLRGAESLEDTAFCARLCARLQVPFARRFLELDPGSPSLEALARQERYAVLADEARAAGIRTVVTGHHDDDALETLLMRWMRGTDLAGLSGPRARGVLAPASAAPVQVVRPLLSMRREEVRHLLRENGLVWREDSSNRDPRFTRNRVRHRLLPEIEHVCGRGGVEGLRAFARAVEGLEDELAARTAHLHWSAPGRNDARPAPRGAGGRLPRPALSELAPPLQRRALWRLLSEGTGRAPSQLVLGAILADLRSTQAGRHGLSGGWSLWLRADELRLVPPRRPLATAEGFELACPGSVALPDGRLLEARWGPAQGTPPRDPERVELEAPDPPVGISVRFARPGDRFHALGAPGSRPLVRFLADAGVPREERGAVPLVFWGEELVWVAGLRPCEGRRVRRGAGNRLRLQLVGARAPQDGAPGPGAATRRC